MNRRTHWITALVLALVLSPNLTGCTDDSTPTQSLPFSDGGREELPGLGLCLTYLISGSAADGEDGVVISDPTVDVDVTEGCYGSMTPVDVDSLSIQQVWAGSNGDQPSRTTYSHGATFSQFNSGVSPVVPSSKEEAGRPCMQVRLRVDVEVDGTHDSLVKDLQPCAGTQA